MTSAAGRDPRPDDARLLTAAQELRLTEWAYQPYATVSAPPPSQADVKALLADRAALAVRVAEVEARAANAEADARRLRAERDGLIERYGPEARQHRAVNDLAGRGSAGTTAGKDGA